MSFEEDPASIRESYPPLGRGAIPPLLLRLGARVIDSLVSEAPLLLFAYSRGWLKLEKDAIVSHAPKWFPVVLAVVAIAYEFVLTAWRGQTFGKWMLGLRIVRYPDQGHLGATQSAFRVLLPALPGAIGLAVPESSVALASFLGIAGNYLYLTAIFNPLGRGLHDRAANSIVLRSR